MLDVMLYTDAAMDSVGVLTCFSGGLFEVVAQLAHPMASMIVLTT